MNYFYICPTFLLISMKYSNVFSGILYQSFFNWNVTQGDSSSTLQIFAVSWKIKRLVSVQKTWVPHTTTQLHVTFFKWWYIFKQVFPEIIVKHIIFAYHTYQCLNGHVSMDFTLLAILNLKSSLFSCFAASAAKTALLDSARNITWMYKQHHSCVGLLSRCILLRLIPYDVFIGHLR